MGKIKVGETTSVHGVTYRGESYARVLDVITWVDSLIKDAEDLRPMEPVKLLQSIRSDLTYLLR